MTAVRRTVTCLLAVLTGLLCGCAAPRPAAAPAPVPTPTRLVSPADVARGAAAAGVACSALRRVAAATDTAQVRQLRATADRAARAAAALDPRWGSFAADLRGLRELENRYAKANVNVAYALSPKIDAARARVPAHCA